MYDKNQLRIRFSDGILPFIRFLQGLGIKPTQITVTGLVLTIAACYSFYLEDYIITFVLMAIGRGCDAIDGAFARSTNQVTRFGGFVDSLVDRYGEFMIVGTILYVYRDDAYLYYFSCLIFLGISLMSYTRALFEKYGMDCPGNPFEFFERGILMVVFFLLGSLDIWLIVIALGTNLFVLQRIYLFSRQAG
ncbi:MAG: CDP-alcohol phosphatidyltransferase family protein [Methylococcaceae bacterium]|nr:CDP-alcohol phosphatidyltransferase family protein [Methylococcaceae bacterium]